jgi:hypothetical protein
MISSVILKQQLHKLSLLMLEQTFNNQVPIIKSYGFSLKYETVKNGIGVVIAILLKPTTFRKYIVSSAIPSELSGT